MSVFKRISSFVRKHPWAVILTCLVLTAALGSGALFLEGQVTYYSILPDDVPSVTALETAGEKLGGIAFQSVLITAPRVTSPRIVEFIIGLEEVFTEDPRFNRGQVQISRDRYPEDAPEILRKPVPVIQSYLNSFVANIKKEVAAAGFDIPLSILTDDMVQIMTGKGLQELVEEDFLADPRARSALVGRHGFITPDYDAALILIKVGEDLTDGEQVKLANDLDDLFGEGLAGVEGAKVDIAGDATIARDLDRHIRNKTILLFVVAMALVVGMLFLAFRRFSDTLLPVLVMALGLVWTFGLMGWARIPYSVASITIVPLLLGTALTYVVPFVARYYEEIRHHYRSVVAVGTALTTISTGLFLAAITNFFGFMVFRFSILPPLKDFGLSCAFGTVFIFGLSVTVLPAVMVVRDRFYEKIPEEKRAERVTHFDGLSRRKKRGLFARVTDRMLEAFGSLSTLHPVLVISVFSLLILAGFVQIRSLTTDSDLRLLVPRGLPGISADFKIEEHFGGRQRDVILVKGDVLSPKSLGVMSGLADAIAGDERNIYGGRHLYPRAGITGLAEALTEANEGVLPASREEAENAVFMAEDNGSFVVGTLLSEERDAALVTLDGAAADTTEAVDRKAELLERHCRDLLPGAGLDYEFAGITPVTRDMTKNIIPTEVLSSVLSLGLCAFILVIIFRSFAYGLITLTVAFAGVAAELGFLSLMNWPLDLITSLVSALVIGIGINFGILFTHRYIQEMRPGDKLPSEAIRSTLMNLGRANVVAALACMAAFLIVMLSDIVPLRRFGGVTAFAIGWCLVSSLTLLPSLLLRFSGFRAGVEEQGVPGEVGPESA